MQSDGGRVEDSFDSSWHWPKIAALSLEQQSLVLLAVPPDTQNKPLRQRLASRLQKSMTPQWFSGGSLAELFAVLCSLQERAPQYIGGTQLAYAAKRLVVAELSVGGPYMSDNGSPDVLTNARVALCLQRAGAPLPKVLGYLRNQLAAMYLPGPTAPLLAEYALWQVVVRLTDPTLKAVMRQRWQLLPVPPAGSLEALLHTDVSERLRLLTAAQESATDVWAIRHTAVFGSAKQQLLHLPATFQSLMLQMLEKIKKADHNYEIALLPAFFAADKQAAIAGEALEQLSAANIFAWMAYIIYDDFVDEEGQPAMLPIANTAMRLSLQNYRQVLPEDAQFQAFVEETFTRVDAANGWEVQHCRLARNRDHITIAVLPDFGDLDFLARRSFIHALGPLAVLRLTQTTMEATQWKDTVEGFRQYLIARQLNDDINDCFEDLAAGQVTYVVSRLLRHSRLPAATYYSSQLEQQLRGVFWREVLPEIVATTKKHLTQARRAFRRAEVSEAGHIYELLRAIDQTLDAGMLRRQQSVDFLQAFEETAD